MNRAATIGLLIFFLSCSNETARKAAGAPENRSKSDETSKNGAAGASNRLTCRYPYRADLGTPFVVTVSLRGAQDDSARPLHITMGAIGADIKYEPPSFRLNPGQRQLVNVTVKSSRTGLAIVNAYPGEGDEQDICDVTIDVGFQGHLKVTALPLSYNEAQSLNVQIVDNNEKPIAAGTQLSMELQSADADLSTSKFQPEAKPNDRNPLVSLDVPVGSTASLPFSIRSLNLKGGPVHLLATLKKDDQVLTQNVFSLDTEPVWWLPIALAIGGAIVYGFYHDLEETDSNSHWRSALPLRLLATVLAGVIAYLFADFDLLGLKLDPHLLRTYPLLGFLFSFLGVDILVSKRFGAHKSSADQELREVEAKKNQSTLPIS